MTTLLRARKGEREQLIELLDAQHATVDEAADAVWRLVARHVLARDWFVSVSLGGSGAGELWVDGPWGSREQSLKGLYSLPYPADYRIYIRKLMTTAAEYEQPMLGDADA